MEAIRKKGTFEVSSDFMLNGSKFKIISGALHYFRVVPEYWRDRLEKLKAMGCNTVETYVPWNLHEPERMKFDFTGILDIFRFIELADELGLKVIVRPSPYICAEWEFGGLPAWLIAEKNIKLRTRNELFIECVKEYWDYLLPKLASYQITEGGPIILMQIENEYGAYGNDKKYLECLRDIMMGNNIVVPLITSDGPWDDYLQCGSIPGTLPTANFGSKAEEQFKILNRFTENKPKMCTEFWIGWFDAWGDEKHHVVDGHTNSKDLDEILSQGSVNIYMFHGGTNFGFMNGANYYEKIMPDVTSYDYDAPLSEDGRITKKYLEFKKVISKYTDIPDVKFSTDIHYKDYGVINAESRVSLWNTLNTIAGPVESSETKSMELLGQNYGYILYHTEIAEKQKSDTLKLLGANDRAKIYIDKKEKATLYDKELINEVKLGIPEQESAELDILVENMGRVNYGPKMEHQAKGIADGVLINGRYHFGWEHYTLALDNIDKVDFNAGYSEGTPAFYKFCPTIDECADTFLDITGFGKGCVFVNGFNLGRYWSIGPQKRLYIPAPLLKKGVNSIIVFETEGQAAGSISLKADPQL